VSTDPAERDMPSFGTVLEVSGDAVRVWVSGVTDVSGAWIPVPPDAAGWLPEEGRDFTVSGNLASLETAVYSPHKADGEHG
jgi:hypothetical protein